MRYFLNRALSDRELARVIGRRRRPPEPAWRPRVDAVRRTLRAHPSAHWLDGSIDDIERALATATDDQDRLHAALAQLDPTGTSDALKAALRQRSLTRRGDEQVIASLQRRHLTIHQLHDRIEELQARIDAAVTDLEHVVARSLVVTIDADTTHLDSELDRLRDDLSALESAHDELRGL
ncbi:MAG: hypothetical protein AB7Q42_03990 [Acidimicrobiia bacterium]